MPFISVLKQLPNLKDLTIDLPNLPDNQLKRVLDAFEGKRISVPFLTVGWGEFPLQFLGCVDVNTLVGISLKEDDFTSHLFFEIRKRFPDIKRLKVCIREFIRRTRHNMKDMPMLSSLQLEDTLMPELYTYINKSFPELECLSAMAPTNSDTVSKYNPNFGKAFWSDTEIADVVRNMVCFPSEHVLTLWTGTGDWKLLCSSQ